MSIKLKKLSAIFDILYGVNLELNKMTLCKKDNPNAINFVSRTDKNNGVSAIVNRIEGIVPNPANTISVAGGGSVLASFVQPEPYYSGRDLYVLTPKEQMKENEMIYYCHCIRMNRYKYNYGRQANKTLGDIMLPATIPGWVNNTQLGNILNENPIVNKRIQINTDKWAWFKYSDLFEIDRGRGARLNTANTTGTTPIVTAIDHNNGWSDRSSNLPCHTANVISVARNGNGVAEAFYQPQSFCSTEDVHVFKAKFALTPYIALFLTTLIRKEKYRYNYGRKWGLQRMNDTRIKLPVKNGKPDFEYMENYVKSLPYSSSI